ncbi:MAG: Methionyl-tRNA formyltransferase [Parcubacteria bacterium OLB19]|nr:MAG: Methionyl-tRNA formyltransferase [Parcubacteria bacterium OLB19]
MKIAFFGTPEIASIVLEELKNANLIPNLIITNPDAPVGRKQILTPPPVKIWAQNQSIPVTQPLSLKNPDLLPEITDQEWDLFIVVAYGKIIPSWLLAKPKYGTVNVHPSLLPKLRGASPIRSAILNDIKDTGVTIMLMDEELDHGPILYQEKTPIETDSWPIDGQELDKIMAHQGGRMLAKIIPDYIQGRISPTSQDHKQATFCTKITKDMSELTIDPYHLPEGEAAYKILLKIRAFAGWPETFFIHNNKRYKIKQAKISNNKLEILRVVPEGKTETDFSLCFR